MSSSKEGGEPTTKKRRIAEEEPEDDEQRGGEEEENYNNSNKQQQQQQQHLLWSAVGGGDGEDGGVALSPTTAAYYSSVLFADDDDDDDATETAAAAAAAAKQLPPWVYQHAVEGVTSDFTIKVVVTGGEEQEKEKEETSKNSKKEVTVYRVHKSRLVQAGYFSSLLDNGGGKQRFAEYDGDELVLDLDDDEEAAAVFPFLLRFVYTNKLELDEGEAGLPLIRAMLTLIRVSDYFLMDNLKNKLINLSCEEMIHSKKKFIEYLPEIMPVWDFKWMEEIESEARRLVVESILALGSEGNAPLAFFDDVVGSIDSSEFFFRVLDRCRDIIAGRKVVGDDDSEKHHSPSTAVAWFLAAHPDLVTLDLFKKLTCDTLLPSIAPGVALQLLELESELFMSEQHVMSEGKDDEGGDEQVAATKSVSLLKRCTTALFKNNGGSNPVFSTKQSSFLRLAMKEMLSKDDFLELISPSLSKDEKLDNDVDNDNKGVSSSPSCSDPHHIYVYSGDYKGSYKKCNKSFRANGENGVLHYEGSSYGKAAGVWKKEGDNGNWYFGHQQEGSTDNNNAASDGNDDNNNNNNKWTWGYSVSPMAGSAYPPSWGWKINGSKRLPPMHLVFRKGVESEF